MAGIVVNSFGEVVEGDSCIGGCVNVSQVAEKALTPNEFQRWLKVRSKALDRKVDEAVDQQFVIDLKASLPTPQVRFVRRVWALQKLNDDRFRIYGRMKGNTPSIILVIEFQWLLERLEVTRAIRELARNTKAKVWVMSEDEHLDSCGKSTEAKSAKLVREEIVAEGRTLRNDGKPDERGYIWSTGPNHGKKERQVELSWEVYGKTVSQIKQLRKRLTKYTDELWNQAGVSVI